MELTLTHLDGTRGARKILPNTDPVSGVAVFTARPSKSSDRAYGLTQDWLAAYGVRSDVAGVGRNVDESLLLIRARIRTFGTRIVIVRHANNFIPHADTGLLDLLAQTCAAEGVDLALTCDDTVGADLAEWIEREGGSVDHSPERLIALLPTTPAQAVGATSDFPRAVPRGDFYMFRSRARDLLTAAQFGVVDEVYVRTARQVHRAPFTSAEDAGLRLRALLGGTDNPAEAITMLRAAQAAMFKRGLLLKVDTNFFIRSITDRQHRQLREEELRALRAYRATWRGAAIVLLDSGFTRDQAAALTISDADSLSLTTEATRIVECHRQFRLLRGASPQDPLLGIDMRRMDLARRDAAIDLHLPAAAPNQARDESLSDRWRRNLGTSLLPLSDKHLPTPAELDARWKEAA